jgi:hypothetical protein
MSEKIFTQKKWKGFVFTVSRIWMITLWGALALGTFIPADYHKAIWAVCLIGTFISALHLATND